MSPLRSRLRPLSDFALGLLLLAPVALFVGASLLKYAAGIHEPHEGGPFAAAVFSLSGIIELSVVLLALLAGYALAENLSQS